MEDARQGMGMSAGGVGERVREAAPLHPTSSEPAVPPFPSHPLVMHTLVATCRFARVFSDPGYSRENSPCEETRQGYLEARQMLGAVAGMRPSFGSDSCVRRRACVSGSDKGS